MATFKRGHSAEQQLENNRRAIARIDKHLHQHLIVHVYDAADTRTLRGIPAIGKGVAGASPGTRPDAITERDDNRAA